MTPRSDRWFVATLAIVAAVYIVIAVQVVDRLEPLTGDEPFYVMTAISIIRDRDLDESNNYANRDYDEFYPSEPLPVAWDGWPAFPRTLAPHPATTDRDGLHTKHGLGLSLLITVPYELAGRIGAVSVLLGFAMLVAANMYWLARDAFVTPQWAAAVTAMLAISMPIAPYAALIFPEIPAALAIVYAVRRLAVPMNSRLQWLGIGVALGALPWLHQRFVPSVLVLVAYALWVLVKARVLSNMLATIVPVAICGVGLVGYNLWLYGGPVQDTADHAGFNGLTGTVNAGFGLLLDAQWGLLVAAPVYLLAIVSIPAWARFSPTARLALLAVIPYLLVVASYRVWWGEWGPPARYLVPVAPFAAGALAVWIRHVRLPGRIATGVLWGMGALLTIVGIGNPQRFYHHPNGINNLIGTIDEELATTLQDILVAFQPYSVGPLHERISVALVLLAALLLAAITIYVLPLIRPDTRSQDEPSESAD